jgi:hypothetical protein
VNALEIFAAWIAGAPRDPGATAVADLESLADTGELLRHVQRAPNRPNLLPLLMDFLEGGRWAGDNWWQSRVPGCARAHS